MIFPTCGNTVIVDDKINEVTPLINLLNSKGASVLYFSGIEQELPKTPFDSIRLVFCDLKFNSGEDSKSVISNVVGLLTRIISESNGPYLLLIWSKHENDYVDDLGKALDGLKIRPEFILTLNKVDYFELKNTLAERIKYETFTRIEKLGLEQEETTEILGIIDQCATSVLEYTYETKPDALEQIQAKLSGELQKANLFHLLFLWENAIGSAAHESINSIYKKIPDHMGDQKKLRLMLFLLSKGRLEKQFEGSPKETRYSAALHVLNEFFSWFSRQKINHLIEEHPCPIEISAIEEANTISPAIFNTWKMIGAPQVDGYPGNVYLDAKKLFKYHGLINKNYFTNQEKYLEIQRKLEADTNITYILVDISSECDIAQNKIFLRRFVPGAILTKTILDQYVIAAELKSANDKPDNFGFLGPVEVLENESFILLNTNQVFSDEPISKDLCKFSVSISIVKYIQILASASISKFGIESF